MTITSPVSPALPASVADLVDELQDVFAAEKELGETINYVDQSPESQERLKSKVMAAVRKAVDAGGFKAFQPFVHFSTEHYVRNLIFANDDFELLVLCWGKGQGSRVHNHARSHGFVTVLNGRVQETRYTNPRANIHDDSVPTSPRESPAKPPALPGVLAAISPCPPLAETQTVVGGPGAQLYINDGMALHAVRCSDDTDWEEGAATLHLYAPPVRRVFLYEPENDRVVQRVPGVFSKAGVPLRKDP